MFEKAKDWCLDHPEILVYGGLLISYAAGVGVGCYVTRNRFNTGLNVMCVADPTLVDHLKSAGEAAKDTLTKIKNF